MLFLRARESKCTPLKALHARLLLVETCHTLWRPCSSKAPTVGHGKLESGRRVPSVLLDELSSFFTTNESLDGIKFCPITDRSRGFRVR